MAEGRDCELSSASRPQEALLRSLHILGREGDGEAQPTIAAWSTSAAWRSCAAVTWL